MFEISWSELLILAVVTLIFVGPKDLPVFFNTLGRYAGAVRRQANEFRRHFEDAMREAEMDSLRRELDGVRDDFQKSVRDAELAASREIAEVDSEVGGVKTAIEAPTADTNGVPDVGKGADTAPKAGA